MSAALIIPIVLQLAGVIVLIAEIVLPSGGVLTILSIGLFGYSLFMVFTTFSGTIGMIFVLADVIILPVALYFGIQMLARGPATLKSTLLRTSGFSSQSEELIRYLDQPGTAMTDLRPAGAARISGNRVDVVSRGEYIEKGAEIVVIKVEGNRVVVRQKA